MTSSFGFGFSGDDIEEDYVDSFSGDDIEGGYVDVGKDLVEDNTVAAPEPTLLEPRRHSLDELISTLPSRISYNVLRPPPSSTQPQLHFPRREVFDIRAQLMAEEDEDTDPSTTRTLIANLERGDIDPRVYEGGFKTWECAVDLAKILIEPPEPHESLRGHLDEALKYGRDVHVIELGAGTALPTASLLASLLDAPNPTPDAPITQKIHFTLCDYNLPVLALATFPNLLLSHAAHAQKHLWITPETDNDLEITEEVLSAFKTALATRCITIDFISGAWGPQLVELAMQKATHLCVLHECLILASETIYSPSSLPAFTSTLSALLRTTHPSYTEPVALIAAKRIYFGVGGGVDEFKALAREEGMVASEIWGTDHDWLREDTGVARVVMEVMLRERQLDEGVQTQPAVEASLGGT